MVPLQLLLPLISTGENDVFMPAFIQNLTGSGKTPASISSYWADARIWHDYLRSWNGRFAKRE